MKKRMIMLSALMAAFLVRFALYAEPVLLTDAVTAAENWIASGEAMGTELSAQAVGAQTYVDGEGEDAVHVVTLDGGGFVVTSTDDEIEPILAYSGTGTFSADEGSPLAALLDADVRARKAAIGQNGNGGLRLMAAASASVNDEANDNKSKWDRLLGRNAVRGLRLMSASGLPTVSIVCVAPLIQSKWDQESIGLVFKDKCYNYYTPNGYPCGCVATAMAQVMRYYQYPTSYISPQTVKCKVEGVSQYLTMKGGYYDWSNMPVNPSSGTTFAQREAIGKLTYDCGVAVGMAYSNKSSSASMEDAKKTMKNTFGYYSADYKLWPVLVTFHNLVTNDLQLARPVLLGITGKKGHAIVADGYGFSSGALYYHLNMGWGGQDDLWYNLPTVTTSYYSYNVIQDLIYNIKPTSNWQKTDAVTLDRQGGSGGTASVTATYGSAMPAISVPTRSGYTFGGYYTSTGGSGTQYYTADGTSARTWDKTGATTLYAKWTALPATYTVTYKPGAYGIGLQQTATKTQNISLTLKGALFTRNGYTQTGWSTTDGGAKAYDLYGSYTANASITLYPYWTAKTISLATAVDNTALVFTTGGDAFWYGQVDVTHDGVDAVRSGKIGKNQYTWMRTTVEGSGEISFWWKCDTGNNCLLEWRDVVDFKVDNTMVSRIYDNLDWRKVTVPVKGWGEHTLEWIYTKDSHGAWESRADCAWVDQVEWKPMVTVTLDAQGGTVASNELFLARNDYNGYGYNVLPTPTWVNRTFLGWYTAKVGGTRVDYLSTTPAQDMTLYAHWQEDRYWLWDDDWGSWLYLYTGGDAQWTEVTTPTYSGSYAFKSGTIGHGKTTWMEKEVSGPGRLTFCWKPSSEMNCDVCVFSVNGEEERRISGVSNDWSYVSCTISEPGSHTLRWTYSKNGNTVRGSDCVWVDGITWQPQVSVTLDGNGGTTYGRTSWGVTKYVGDGFTYLPSPTRTGYRFDGWFTTRYGGVRVDANTIVSADLSILYAHWLKEEPLADVLDTTLAVTTGGSSTWFGQTAVSSDGVSAACSGRLSYGQSNWMEITATGAGRLRFAWAIDGHSYSTATYSDSLSFQTNGIEAARINGRHEWTNCVFTVGSGTHKFRWLYSKNGFSSIGADCAWVDDVVWEPEGWVFFKPEGGDLSQTWFRGYVGDEVVLPTPVRDGYKFEGWFTEQGGGEKIDGASFVLDRTRWLYARWSFTGVSARDYDNRAVYLTWGLSPEAALYSVYRSTTDEWVDANWLSDRTYRWYFDYSATPGVDYWYWIVATDADGRNRAYSNVATGRREVSLSLGEEEISLDALAGSGTVDVRANTSWRAVSSASWLELTTSSGNGDGLLSYAFTHNFSRNARTATITVTAGGGTAHSKTQTIHVLQSGWNGGVSLEAEEYGIVAGVPLDGSEIMPEVAEGYTLKVAGLPSGMKYDARSGMIVGTPTAKAGAYTVKFTATPDSYLKMAGAPVETATVVVNVAYPTLTLETEAWGDDRATGSVKGGGAFAANKKVTLTATPAKGCVFAGWFEPCQDGMVDYRTASYPYVTSDYDETLVAMFATMEEDEAYLSVDIDDVTTEDDGTLELDLGAYVESLSLPKLAVSGLPSGVRYDAKTMMLTGKAAKPGVYAVTVKATNASVKRATEASTAIFKITVPNLSCSALPNLLPESDAYGTVRCGVKFDAALIDCSPADGWTVKAAGLPSGLKFATRNTKDAKYGAVPAWTVYGVPTAKAGAYTVTFTASKKGAKSQTATITLNVEALPEWAVGTFDGVVYSSTGGSSVQGDDGGGRGATALPVDADGRAGSLLPAASGTVALTIAANGKISGKMLKDGLTWTLSAASFDGVSGGHEATALPTAGCPVFVATVIGKNGKQAITNEVEVSAEEIEAGTRDAYPCQRGVVAAVGRRDGGIAPYLDEAWTAWQNLWKKEPWKSEARAFSKAPVLNVQIGGHAGRVPLPGDDYAGRETMPDDGIYGMVTLRFAASGAVTASGKFAMGVDSRGKDIVYSASCSSVLVPDFGSCVETAQLDPVARDVRPYRVFIYFAPKAGKFGGYAAEIPLVWDDEEFGIGK